jgi:hypothetical protein
VYGSNFFERASGRYEVRRALLCDVVEGKEGLKVKEGGKNAGIEKDESRKTKGERKGKE